MYPATEHMLKTQAKYKNKKLKDLPEELADVKEARLKQKVAEDGWKAVDHKFHFNVMNLDQETINAIYRVKSFIDLIALEAYQDGFIKGYREKEDE